VAARRRIAVDSWDGFVDYLQPPIERHVGSVTELAFLEPDSVNFAFASNLFEHISQSDFASVLAQLKRALAAGGTLNILQPNYYYCYREYFDDYTHRTIFTHVSLPDCLSAHGFAVERVEARFLPLTFKSRLPAWPWLVDLYLRLPWRPLAKQMLVVARRA